MSAAASLRREGMPLPDWFRYVDRQSLHPSVGASITTHYFSRRRRASIDEVDWEKKEEWSVPAFLVPHGQLGDSAEPAEVQALLNRAVGDIRASSVEFRPWSVSAERFDFGETTFLGDVRAEPWLVTRLQPVTGELIVEPRADFVRYHALDMRRQRAPATPARHYSGRSLGDRDRTVWAGWAIASARHRVFYSGDTSLHDEFIEIGRRLGPFDLTMIKSGEYNAWWADVHLGPEQAVFAHRLVRGDVMLPVHWAGFDLAMHGWTEPMERLLGAADSQGVRVAMP